MTKANGKRLWVLGAGVLLLAARPAAAQQTVQRSDVSRLPSAVHRPPSADAAPDETPAAFWAVLGDTTLSRLIIQALSANRDVQAAHARVMSARAERTRAGLGLTPSLTADAGYARQQYSNSSFPGVVGTLPAQDAYQAGLNLGWEIDVFGRNRKNWQGRRSVASSTQEDLRNVQVQVSAELATAYFDLAGARDRLATARRNVDNMRSTLTLTQDRLAAGRGNAFDSERARAQLSSTLAELPRIEAAVDVIQQRIAVLTGGAVTRVDEAATSEAWPTLPDSITVPSVDAVVDGRPDVRSAQHRSAAQSAFAGSASADYLPRIALIGSAGYLSGSSATFGDQGTGRYTIGAAVSWPLLDLGRVKADADAARAGADEARAQYQQAQFRAREDLATALVNYQRARERLTYLDDAASASERAMELARVRFQEGATDFLQVLDAQRTLLAAQDRRSTGRTDATDALVAVYRALGGNWPR